jgi:hypothetical protein
LKQYQFLVQECKIVFRYLKSPFGFSGLPRANGKLGLIKKSLKPTMWTLIYDEYERVMVDNYTGYEKCHFIY